MKIPWLLSRSGSITCNLTNTRTFTIGGFIAQPHSLLLDEPAAYIELVLSLPTPPVFIFDTLVRFHSAESETSSSAMAPVMAALRKIAATGATVLVLHHRGKSEFSQYAARATSRPR